MKTIIEIVGDYSVVMQVDEEGKVTVTYYRAFGPNRWGLCTHYEVGDLIHMGIDNNVQGFKLVGLEGYSVTLEEIKPVFAWVENYAKENGLWLWSY